MTPGLAFLLMTIVWPPFEMEFPAGHALPDGIRTVIVALPASDFVRRSLAYAILIVGVARRRVSSCRTLRLLSDPG